MTTAGEDRSQELDSSYWEAVWSAVHLPLIRDPRAYHELHTLFSRYLPKSNLSLLEVGCAPGSWMAYFARQFGYRVSGIEYAEKACVKTEENLRLLRVEGSIERGDFFEFEGGPYDLVFSSGFVEHYPDLKGTIGRIARLCKPGGFVITAIPSLEGLNWWISRTFRPSVAAGHFPCSLPVLAEAHEAHGLQTLALQRYGGLQVVSPWDKTQIAKWSPWLARQLGLPFRIWNSGVSLLTYLTGWYPQSRPLFAGVIYIGRKSPDLLTSSGSIDRQG